MALNIQRYRNREYAEFAGKKWKRSVGSTQWDELDTPPPAEARTELKLVRQWQSPDEPNHWLLFLSRKGLECTVYQVQGDATCMHHAHATGIKVENSASYEDAAGVDINVENSDSLKDAYIIAWPTDQQAERVHYWATREVPPSAPNQAAVQENCQGWSTRVIARLVEEGIVQKRWQTFAENIQEPIIH